MEVAIQNLDTTAIEARLPEHIKTNTANLEGKAMEHINALEFAVTAAGQRTEEHQVYWKSMLSTRLSGRTPSAC